MAEDVAWGLIDPRFIKVGHKANSSYQSLCRLW